MCGHNLCNLQSTLPRRAPRVLSISAGRGGARLAFRKAGQPVFPRGGVGRGEHPWSVLKGSSEATLLLILLIFMLFYTIRPL